MNNDNQVELKYHEKLNISSLSIESIKHLIKNNIKNTFNAWKKNIPVERQCFHIIGPAGVGKTDIMKQIGNELSNEMNEPFNVIIIKSPVLTRDDLILPFPVIDNGNTTFKMLYSDFVPDNKKETKGIFVIDEFSRGDHAFQQLMWQVQNEYSLHMYKFPKGWFVISLDNPDDREYSMEMFEDSAGLRRQLHLYVQLSVKDFLNHARKNNFHKQVIDFINTYPNYLYDFDSQKIGSVYANPASYERLSDHLWKYEQDEKGIDGNLIDIELLASGLLNSTMAKTFISFIEDNESHIPPEKIFYAYDKVEDKIEEYIQKGDSAKLSELITSFCTYLSSNKPKYEDDNIQNIGKFLLTLPLDIAVIFITNIENAPPDVRHYFLFLNKELTDKSEDFKLTFEKLNEIVGR